MAELHITIWAPRLSNSVADNVTNAPLLCAIPSHAHITEEVRPSMAPLKGLADQILVVGHVRLALAAGVELFSGQILLEELALQWVAGARVKRSDSPPLRRPAQPAHPRTIGSRLWASSERGALQCWTGSGRVTDGRARGARGCACRRGASQIDRRLEGAAHRCQGPTIGKQKYDLTTSSRLRTSANSCLNVIAGPRGVP